MVLPFSYNTIKHNVKEHSWAVKKCFLMKSWRENRLKKVEEGAIEPK